MYDSTLDDRKHQEIVKVFLLPHTRQAKRKKNVSFHGTDEINSFEEKEKYIFTDGGKVGAAYNVFSNSREMTVRKLPMADYYSVFQDKLFALIKALERFSNRQRDYK